MEIKTWDTEKYDKHGVDPDDYDHSDISSRPLILFNLFAKNKEPYLTVKDYGII